jgi:hypothetical protein
VNVEGVRVTLEGNWTLSIGSQEAVVHDMGYAEATTWGACSERVLIKASKGTLSCSCNKQGNAHSAACGRVLAAIIILCRLFLSIVPGPHHEMEPNLVSLTLAITSTVK